MVNLTNDAVGIVDDQELHPDAVDEAVDKENTNKVSVLTENQVSGLSGDVVFPAGASGAPTLPKLIADITYEVIAEELKKGPPYNPKIWEGQVVSQVSGAIATLNPMRPKGQKFPSFYKLTPWQIAKMILAMYEVRMIWLVDDKDVAQEISHLIGIYDERTGLYDISPITLRKVARQFNSQISKREMDEVVSVLEEEAKEVYVDHDKDLVPMANGILNYRTKQLVDYSPRFVFLVKSSTRYVDNPVLPVIHNDEDDTDWDPESWMESLSDDPDLVQLFWEITGSVLRPNVPWNKLILLYSRVGCNGKGTLCSLWRDLIGMSMCATLQLDEMDKDFALEKLIRAKAIIADENPVGIFLDKISKLKSIVTGDRITITRKFEKAVEVNFRGVVIQCVNELPNFKDRTNSIYRRQLIVPFDKSFENFERKYIKEDYLKRDEVKEYIAWRALNLDFYELSVPEACQEALEDFKIWNDPIREFVQDVLSRLTWTAFTLEFAYSLYVAWFDKTNPSGKKVQMKVFHDALKAIFMESLEWEEKRSIKMRAHTKAPELLILEYGLKEYMNPTYAGADAKKQACFDYGSKQCRGFLRNRAYRANVAEDGVEDVGEREE